MIERGKVCEVSGTTVTVDKQTMEFSFGCKCHGLHPVSRSLRAENKEGFPLSPGQLVEVETPTGRLVTQGLFTLLPPVLGFLGGYLLVPRLFPAIPPRISLDAPSAMGGVVGLFAAAFLVFFIRKLLPAKTAAKIIRIL